jgi:glycosyltransferase involved in cell wall biosynthesis
MVWFLRDVYPRIQHGQPNATLMITGDHANLPLPAATGVTLSGHVQDVRPAIAGAWCSIAPLQTGGGTRLKILEAMALGTPVVATSKGAEGLNVVDGVHLLIGDTPETFANAVERVLQEPELRQRLIDNARRLVYSEYEWTRVMPRFLDLVEWAAHDEPMRMEPLR